MTSLGWQHQWLYMGLALFPIAFALDVNTFGGQAEASLLMRKAAETPESELKVVQAAADESAENDYTCSAQRPCKIGCCGPL